MKKKYYVFFLLLSFLGYGQAINWEKNFGGSGDDYANSIQKTTDGGYIVVGRTSSSASGNVTGVNNGSADFWVVKLTSSGNISWEKILGGRGADEAFAVQQTTDGGYIIAGSTGSSASGNVTGVNNGADDFWIVKLTSLGAISWEKNFGGGGSDIPRSIQQTTDGGYIIAGVTGSTNIKGDITGNNGGFDAWIIKLNSSGVISWQKNLGGSGHDSFFSIQQTTDDGYIAAGITASSNTGDVTGTTKGGDDFWIVKLTSNGTISWQKNLGGNGSDVANSIRQTLDGGYIVAGYTKSSNNGDVTGINKGSDDFWIVKLTPNGTISWQNNFGGNREDQASSIQQTSDGGYIVVGSTLSSGTGDVTGTYHSNNFDVWIVKLTSSGIISWQKNLGGNGGDRGKFVQQSSSGKFVSNNKYIIAGYTDSSANGDVTGVGRGNYDMWIVNISDTPPQIVDPNDIAYPQNKN